MTSASQRLQQYFDELADLAPAERAATLQRLDAEDAALAQRLRELLAADADLGDAPTQPLRELGPLATADTPPADSVPGYQLLDRLGAGGMGTVYRARRTDAPESLVAIKFLRAERDDPLLRQRFALEARVLQSLQHPGIARLIGSGDNTQGTPWVAMELIEGHELLAYADTHKLDLEQRVGLLLKVCAAVTHAHARRIIHRDIKSSNILVDAAGQPRLLDFGIAKPLHAQFGTQHLQRTATAQRFFSVASAAPEQLTGDAVGPGCDIYALGALLYELLCGEPPLLLQGLSAGQAETAILRQVPQPPSLRIANLPPGLANARARQRGLPDRTALAEKLRGEADRICARALRKHSAQRQASVEEFARELRAWRAGRQRGGAWRNWPHYLAASRPLQAGVGVAAAVLLALLAWALWPAPAPVVAPGAEAAIAETTMPETAAPTSAPDAATLIAVAEADIAQGAAIRALQTLQAAELALPAADDAQPLRVRLLLARTAAAIDSGDFAQAGLALRQADDLAPDPRQRQGIALQRARLLQARGRPEEAAAVLRELAAEALPQLPPEDPRAVQIRQQLQALGLSETAAETPVATPASGASNRFKLSELEALAASLSQARDDAAPPKLPSAVTARSEAPAPATAPAVASAAAAQLERLVEQACSDNRAGRYAQAQQALATALELHRSEPALRHTDSFRVGVLAQAVADHALARDPASAERLRHELEREAWLSGEPGRARWREQAALARKLGVAVD